MGSAATLASNFRPTNDRQNSAPKNKDLSPQVIASHAALILSAYGKRLMPQCRDKTEFDQV
jgi:hypothetical protein